VNAKCINCQKCNPVPPIHGDANSSYVLTTGKLFFFSSLLFFVAISSSYFFASINFKIVQCCDDPRVHFVSSNVSEIGVGMIQIALSSLFSLLTSHPKIECEAIDFHRDCVLCSDETNELKCPTCNVSYHKECAKKWLRKQKNLPSNFLVCQERNIDLDKRDKSE